MFGRATITLGIGPHSSLSFTAAGSSLNNLNPGISISLSNISTLSHVSVIPTTSTFSILIKTCSSSRLVPLVIRHTLAYSTLMLLIMQILLQPPYGIGQAIIFLPCDFYHFSSFYLFSPNLSGRIFDVYHTHAVALVRIYNACLKFAARGSIKIQDAKIAILAPSHNCVGLYLRS